MEFHILPIITLFMVAVVATNGALPPEIYWKSMLPTTAMPKAITDLLRPADWREEKDTSVDVWNGGVNVGVENGKQGGSGSPTGVNVGDGGVNIRTGPKGKPVHVGVGPNNPFNYIYASKDTQLHDDPNVALFFLEKDLRCGTKLNLHFTKIPNTESTFLSHSLARSIPFSSNKMNDIFNKFSIKKGSNEAQIVHNTIRECEGPSIKGEEKLCVTSLESMIDFATSKLGNNIDAISTQVTKESDQLQQYTMAQGVKKLGEDDKGVMCHKEKYPYAVFYCHKSNTTRAYSIPLEGANGSRVKAVAVCHTDTSKWNPKHLAFQVLQIQPGTLPICHFLPQDHVVFVPK